MSQPIGGYRERKMRLKTRKILFWIITIALAFVIVSSSMLSLEVAAKRHKNTPTPTPTPIPIPTPTATASPTPTIIPTPSPTITPAPTPPPTSNPSLTVKAITVHLNNLYYSPNAPVPKNYQPNGWTLLKNLGINVIRVGEGPEGDIAHFNPINYPNEWASNLNAFLTKAQSNGMRVTFQEMGTQWQTFFNVIPPEPAKGIAGSSITQSKAIIDQLAGNNALKINFITDPRIYAWSVGNEIDIGNPTTYNWCINILDYIRSKGGQAFISTPINTTLSSDWLTSINVNSIFPSLAGHVDYLSFNYYNAIYYADNAQKAGQSVYTATYNIMVKELNTYFVSGRGNIAMSNLMIGETGIPSGPTTWNGVYFNFTPQSVSEFYRAIYDSTKTLGIKNLFYFDAFETYNGQGQIASGQPWYCITKDGNYLTEKTNLIKAAI